jgi:hypothetical protein
MAEKPMLTVKHAVIFWDEGKQLKKSIRKLFHDQIISL